MSDRSSRPLIFLALAAALAATGCNKPNAADQLTATNSAAPLPTLPATLPLATGTASTPRYAPPVAALPAARQVRTVRVADPRDDYAYADDAYAFSNALGDAPPDYGFDYGGAEPWAWEGYDRSRVFVEPVSDGYRYYYYRPDADEPYFVRDPDYGYGYDNGALAVIYAASGAVLPFADYGPRLGYASRYLARGEDLYRASRGNDRRAVIAANWAARQDSIAASRDRWAGAEARQAGWQAYRARVADQQARHWAQEAERRDADAHRFATWHDDGFRGTPPPRAIPAAWQQASWAQDRARYRPVGPGADRAQPGPGSRLGPDGIDRPQDAQAQPGARGLVTAGGVGLAAGAAGLAAHRFAQGREPASLSPRGGPNDRGPNGVDPGPRGERAIGRQAANATGGRPADAAGSVERRQQRGDTPHGDHGPRAGSPQRGAESDRPAGAVTRSGPAQSDVVHIHRGGVGAGFDAFRQAAHAPGPDRAQNARPEPRSAERPPSAARPAASAFHPSAPAPRSAPAEHAAAAPAQHSAPAPHAAAPAPHPQGGGGGAPHEGGGHHP